MDNSSYLPASTWSAQLREHLQARPLTALGLFIALAAVLLLLLQSLIMLATGEVTSGVRYGLIGGAAGFAATAIGALPALFLRAVPQKVEDTMLGFAAGMMLAASAFSLLLPGLEAAEGITGNGFSAAAVVVVGMTLGVLLMLGLDQFTPHEHDKTGPCGPGHESCSRVWLFVFAIALHNLPEGMAIGVSFSQGDMSVGCRSQPPSRCRIFRRDWRWRWPCAPPVFAPLSPCWLPSPVACSNRLAPCSGSGSPAALPSPTPSDLGSPPAPCCL